MDKSASLLLVLALTSNANCQQPSYQLSILVQLHHGVQPVHLCNGIVIQSRLILTTAACIHDGQLNKIRPSMIIIVAGDSNEFIDATHIKVNKVEAHPEFNPKTLENDIAILSLVSSIDLNRRDDIQWISLDDGNESTESDSPHLARFYERKFNSSNSKYVQTEKLEILPTEECAKNSKNPNSRELDICSFFVPPLGLKCDAIDSQSLFLGIRGTGLVRNSRLVAILSSVLPSSNLNATDCSNPHKAFYTNIKLHIPWIFEEISADSSTDVENNDYVAALPYQELISEISKLPDSGEDSDNKEGNNGIDTMLKESLEINNLDLSPPQIILRDQIYSSSAKRRLSINSLLLILVFWNNFYNRLPLL